MNALRFLVLPVQLRRARASCSFGIKKFKGKKMRQVTLVTASDGKNLALAQKFDATLADLKSITDICQQLLG